MLDKIRLIIFAPSNFMSEVSTPKKASTIILVRPNVTGGFEIFMTRRPLAMKFLGGFYVFPGGTVRKGDYTPRMLSRCVGRSQGEAKIIIGEQQPPEISMGYWVAGIRELYEEVGILLCVTETGNPIIIDQEKTKLRLANKRKALVVGLTNFYHLLESEELYCNVGSPTYFYHRITPEKYSMRFDTRFFLARFPLGQTPLTSSQEVDETIWVTPEQALELYKKGEFPLIPPTITSLKTLTGYNSWSSLTAKYEL